MDIDGIVVELDYKKEEISPGVFKNEWGNIIKFSKEFHAMSEGCIKSLNDLEKYEPPDPLASHRFDKWDKTFDEHNGKKGLILHLNDVFSIPRSLLGYEELFMSIASNPKLVEGLVELSVDYNLSLNRLFYQ